jgi:hypothetical protein
MADRKMKRKQVDWVKARGNGCICLRCGETHTFVLPMPVDDFVKATRGFIGY